MSDLEFTGFPESLRAEVRAYNHMLSAMGIIERSTAIEEERCKEIIHLLSNSATILGLCLEAFKVSKSSTKESKQIEEPDMDTIE